MLMYSRQNTNTPPKYTQTALLSGSFGRGGVRDRLDDGPEKIIIKAGNSKSRDLNQKITAENKQFLLENFGIKVKSTSGKA